MTIETAETYLLHSNSIATSAKIAAKIANAHLPNNCQIHLRGELGTGKTTFVRGLLRAVGYTDPVSSPTFALAAMYEIGQRKFLHLDFFRCVDEHEWLDAGLAEDIATADLVMVEWSDRSASLPLADLAIAITDLGNGDERLLQMHTPSGRCADLLRLLLA